MTKPRLLLVDDDPACCAALGRALQHRGMDVVPARSANEALRSALEHEPEHAVIDLCLGEQSGLSLVKALHDRDPAIRIVVITGYASVATAVEAIKLGGASLSDETRAAGRRAGRAPS